MKNNMTIEEKAKAYDEALEQAKFYHGNCPSEPERKKLEKMFPVLHESEDERIRKWLLECVENLSDGNFIEVSKQDVLFYLEKQKGDKDELVYRLNGLMQDYIKEGKDDEEKEHRLKCYQLFWDALEDANFFEQIEQKPQVVCEAKAYDLGYKQRKEDAIKEQKPVEWSEEDETIIEGACNALEIHGHTKLASMLKSLRPQPQGTYKLIVHNIYEMLKDKDFFDITPSHRVSLLNDIRVRCKNADEQAKILDEPSWKPSEEQMNCLCAAVDAAIRKHNESVSGYKPARVLKSLYEDLQKL